MYISVNGHVVLIYVTDFSVTEHGTLRYVVE